MSKKTIYTDAPDDIDKAIESSVRIDDFLPSPAELRNKQTKQRITIMLDKRIVDFFKQAAEENGGQYQTMINNLLASYVDRQNAYY